MFNIILELDSKNDTFGTLLFFFLLLEDQINYFLKLPWSVLLKFVIMVNLLAGLNVKNYHRYLKAVKSIRINITFKTMNSFHFNCFCFHIHVSC